jgi:hypothetical protein
LYRNQINEIKSALLLFDVKILHKRILDYNIFQNNEQISYEQRKYLDIINSSDILSLVMDIMKSKIYFQFQRVFQVYFNYLQHFLVFKL